MAFPQTESNVTIKLWKWKSCPTTTQELSSGYGVHLFIFQTFQTSSVDDADILKSISWWHQDKIVNCVNPSNLH